MPAVKGAGMWVRGLASEIRGWGARCVLRALEVQDLPVCEEEAALGPPFHIGACSENREARRCADREALKGSRGEEQGTYLKVALDPGVGCCRVGVGPATVLAPAGMAFS